MLWLSGVQPGAFALSAGLLALGLCCTLALREVPGAVPRLIRMSLPRLRPLAMMMAASAGTALLFGGLESIAGTVFPVQGLGMAAVAAASILVATRFGNMLAQNPVGRMADRFGPRAALLG